MTARRRSGIQHDLRHGALTATVASVGASLRTLASDGRDLVVPFEADEVRPAYRGATLAPWPNRVVDGRYAFGGVGRQLPLTEVERGHALHGLVAWTDWDAVDASPAHVRLRTTIAPSLGYPWRVQVDATFALADDGLTQTVEAVNVGDDVAPWGTAPHPYLVAGASPLDDWTLTLPADDVLVVTDDRLSPTTLEPVACDPVRFDFRSPRALGAARIDHAFTGLARGADGLARVLLDDPAHGTGVELAFGAACGWVQIHTADLPGGPAQPGHRAGLAAEPMTCAPDALNAPRYPFDAGLVALAPGERHVASWRIAPR